MIAVPIKSVLNFQVTFYSKNGNDEKLTQIESRNMSYSLPDYALRPAIFVCCKRNETRALKEVSAFRNNSYEGKYLRSSIQFNIFE